MKRILIIGVALFASTLALTASASARLGMAPMAVQDDAVIQVHGGHGHGHMGHHGGRGHHYGWGRGRGHHYGWSRHRH
jgi:Spy/CpxP family protein refolding chaperone